MTTLNSEAVLQFIQNTYQTIDSLHLSMQMLAVIALIVSVAFLFALREVAAWFFKIDNLKRDIRSLEDCIAKLEGEVQSLHQNKKGAEVAPLVAKSVPTKLHRTEQFPINY